MTLDLAKLRAETLALIDGTTPGPWSVFINDAGDEWTGWPLSVSADNIEDKTIIRPGGHWPYEWDAKTSQHEACQNARLIAAAPALAGTILRLVDDNLRLLDEIERLRAENETAVRRSAEWMRNRIAELARQTAANIIAESAGGPRHRRGYEAGRAEAFEIMARTILAVPLPANGAALAEGGPDDR